MAERESSLKRVLDYKLLFDCLADDSSGKIPLKFLSARWPGDSETEDTKFPQGCIDAWKAAADKEGLLDWEAFSNGLSSALKKDQPRARKCSNSFKPEKLSGIGGVNSERSSIGKSLLHNPVKSADIEDFLAECDRKQLVKTLARTKKEVYSCQFALQQQQQQPRSRVAPVNPTSNSNSRKESEEKQQKEHNSENNFAEKSKFDESKIGNEKEELLKGLEVLKQTQQWFSHRLGQLELEGGRKRKPSAEELLAIMEGKSIHPAAQSFHHIQKINAHLSSLALQTPVLATALLRAKQNPATGLASTERNRPQRLMSEPGPVQLSHKPHAGIHRHTATSPPPVAAAALSDMESSKVRVISIDMPAHPVAQGGLLGRFDGQGPRRAESYSEIRSSHNPQARLNQSVKRGISSLEKREPDKRTKPRRSQSFNAAKHVDHNSADGKVFEDSANLLSSPTHNYPLRETMSLNQLPMGVNSNGYSSYSSASQRRSHSSGRRLEDSYHGNYHQGSHHQGRPTSTMRSSSMVTLPSREVPQTKFEQKSRKPSSRFQQKLKEEELRARQAAAHHHVLQTEVYQGPLAPAQVTASNTMI